jgi:hypothetical protein
MLVLVAMSLVGLRNAFMAQASTSLEIFHEQVLAVSFLHAHGLFWCVCVYTTSLPLPEKLPTDYPRDCLSLRATVNPFGGSSTV